MAGGVTLEAIMAQLQWMEADFGGHLDYLTDEMYQMNNRVNRIARKQARIGGFAPSLSPSPEASADKGDDADDLFRWLQDDDLSVTCPLSFVTKGGVVFLFIYFFLYKGSVYSFEGCSEVYMYFFVLFFFF